MEIISYYKKYSKLNESMRSMVVEAVISYMINNNINMSTEVAKTIAEKIKLLFPTESLVT